MVGKEGINCWRRRAKEGNGKDVAPFVDKRKEQEGGSTMWTRRMCKKEAREEMAVDLAQGGGEQAMKALDRRLVLPLPRKEYSPPSRFSFSSHRLFHNSANRGQHIPSTLMNSRYVIFG
jgi:hypothetical protein